MATASGDPGQFGVGQALDRRARAAAASRSATWSRPRTCVFAVAFSPDSKQLAAAGADRAIRIFEVETGQARSPRSRTTPTGSSTSPSAPTASGSPAPAATRRARSSTSRRRSRSSPSPATPQPVYTVAFTPDGKAVATGGEDNQIRIWNPDDDGKQVRADRRLRRHRLPAPATRPTARPWSPAAPTRPSASSRPPTAPRCATLAGPQRLGLLRWPSRRDGKTLASGSWDGEVRLWNLADGKPIRNDPRRARLQAGETTEGSRPGESESRGSGRSEPRNTRETRKRKSRRRTLPRSRLRVTS